jgi:hypothetical protein
VIEGAGSRCVASRGGVAESGVASVAPTGEAS